MVVSGVLLTMVTATHLNAEATVDPMEDPSSALTVKYDHNLLGVFGQKDKTSNVTLNKVVSVGEDRNFIPGVDGSGKNVSSEKIESIKEEQRKEDERIAEQQAEAQVAAQVQEVSYVPTTKTVGNFKVSFYDPAVLGSDMGYDGVAANFGVLPRGTRLKITTSQGDVWYRTVNDTGTFASSNPYQIDVAMPDSLVPSYGITSATVEIVY
ncbi:hypothetical protein [Lactobacillus terrae]|uniref:hypothetical protein n=1 Tax=Lactobacillus terrae TaxID=2269374 RepID=UPI001FE6F248|nr:hypothetical protein [Lactobacillus terrae]